VLREGPDGVTDDLAITFRDEEGLGEEDARLPDEDLGLAVAPAVLPLKERDRGKILFVILPDDQVHTDVFVVMV